MRLKRHKKSRAKFFENGHIDDSEEAENSSAKDIEPTVDNVQLQTCDDSEITIILQKFSHQGQELYKLDEQEFKKPSPQLRLSDGRAKLIIQKEK